MRYHLPHPTQAAACGTNSTALVVSPEVLATKLASLHCKRCLRVYAALTAGRVALRGYDDGESTGGRTADAQAKKEGDS